MDPEQLCVCGLLLSPETSESRQVFDLRLEPSEKKTIVLMDGPLTVEQFSLRIGAGDLDSALRQTVLQITFDDYPWGEGDEKVFVDDDRVPSIFGTGSEDYFNYSWSSPDIFAFPYCGQKSFKIPISLTGKQQIHVALAMTARDRLKRVGIPCR